MPEQIRDLALEIDRLRADTLGCHEVVHLNNAGSALPPEVVTETVIAHLRRESLIGGYEAHAEAGDRVTAARDSVARLLGTRSDRVALCESATEGWSRAYAALTHSGAIVPGSRILTTSAEYASNVIPMLQSARTDGVTVDILPSAADGSVDVGALPDLLDERVSLVALTWAPSQDGLLHDAAGVGRALRESGSAAWYLVDGCQAVGQVPVDVEAIGCDFLAGTGRKFLRGPRGTGFLYAGDRAVTELEPFPLDLNSATWTSLDSYEVQPGARRYEYWETSYAGVLGLGAAVDYALDLGLDAIAARLAGLGGRTRAALVEVPGVTVRDHGAVHGAIITFTVDGVEPAQVQGALREAGINVSLGTPDYALRDYLAQGVTGKVRVSPHVYNTEDDIDALVAVVRRLATS